MESLKLFYLKRIKTSLESYSIIPFKSYNIVIGRSPEATFTIHDCLISRKHAVFSRSTNKDKWIVKNLSLNGVFVNEQLVPKEEEKEVGVGDIIQFGMPANFIYRLGMKIIGSSQIASTSQAKKRLKLDNTTYSQDELTQEHDTLSKRLEEWDALKARLLEEQKSKHNSIREQQELLEKKYKQDREVLEKKYSEGAMAQKFMLEEKESLALELENQLSNLLVVLDTVEAQKLSLEQELACSAIASDNARKEVVDSVSDVLENEMQCPICNELFITAMTLGCSHTFCKYCIGQWKKNKMECPNCRMRITSETRSLVVDNFIEKVVPTLSEELQNKRREIVAERASEIAAMEAQEAAAAQTAARNRGGGRNSSGPDETRTARSTRNSAEPANPPAQPQIEAEETIFVSSDGSETSDTGINSDSSSEYGDDDAYYGGYGRCYVCGRRGHLANGCPSRW